MNLLVAGFDDEKDECEFYVMDYLVSVLINFFCFGVADCGIKMS